MAQSGLIRAWLFDGQGGARLVGWDEVEAGPPAAGFLFAEFKQRPGSEGHSWLAERAELDPVAIALLASDEGKPRCTHVGAGAVLSLRGINLLPSSIPEEALSIRIWVEPRRIFAVREEQIAALADFEDAIGRGRAPRTPGEFVAELALRLVDRVDHAINALVDDADELEEKVWRERLPSIGTDTANLRRIATKLRRHIAPQREALNHFALEDADYLGPRDRSRLREAADRVTRLAEELDSVRERAALIHDQILERRSEVMNSSMLVLAAVTVIFSPLTLISGLFGMNVGGIPLADTPSGFWTISIILGVAGVLLAAFFRAKRWL